jgi:raffinose/stachyose/melibiose transport system substrate-binding protein
MIRTKAPSTRLAMLSVAVIVTTAVALVAGVAVTGATPRATVTLKVLAQSNGQGNPQLQAIFDAFQQKNPDIKIDATYLPIGTTYANTLRTQLQSGNGPDVFYVTAGSGGLQSVLPLAKAGYVADLAKQPWVKTLPLAPANRPFFWRQGRLTALPFAVVPVGVMYHTDVMSDLGIQVPKTTNQFLAACRTAKAKGKYFLNLAGASAQNASLFATVLATSHVLAKDPGWNLKRISGKTTFAGTPEWHTTLQTIVDMKNAGCFPPGAEANDNIPATPGFVSGQVVSWTLPSSIVGLLKGFNKEAKYSFFAMPGTTAADTRVNASPTDAFAVWSKSQQKVAALKLINYMSTPAATGRYAALTGAVSPYQAATGKHILFELTGLKGFLAVNSKVFPLMNLSWPNPQVVEVLGKDVQGLLTGQKNVAQTLSDLDTAWGGK